MNYNFRFWGKRGAGASQHKEAHDVGRAASRAKLTSYLPWCALISPRVILQKAGYFQQVYAYQGLDTDAISQAELNVLCQKLNNALHSFGTGWAIGVEAQRLSYDDYPGDRWPNLASWLIDLERKLSFKEPGRQFLNTYYLSFVWKAPQETQRQAKHIFYESALAQQEADWKELLEQFSGRMAEIELLLGSLFASMRVLEGEELLSYLHSSISFNRQRVAMPEVPFYLDALLADMPLETERPLKLGPYYMPVLSITGFPPETSAALLDRLNTLGLSYRWVTRFIALSDEDAEQVISGYRKRFFGRRKKLGQLLSEEIHQEESPLMDNHSLLGFEEADDALSDLSSGQIGFGYYSAHIVVWDLDEAKAQHKAREVARVLRGAGLVCYEEGLGAREAWFASLPGNVQSGMRRYLLHTMNLVHLLPLSAPWSGYEESKHLKRISGNGHAHVVCSTPLGTPFFLNLGIGDVGHCFIAGPTGSGKSTLLALLESQWLRYPGARVYIFDKDASALGVTLTHGGRCHFAGEEGFALQPLLYIDDPLERGWTHEFLSDLLHLSGVELDPEGSAELSACLEHLASLPPEHRTLSSFVELLQNQTYRLALGSYTRKGTYGGLFDAREETELSEDWIMFEMGSLMEMGDRVVLPALSCIFHRLEKRIRRELRPTLLVLDEAWLFLSHPRFGDRIKIWLKTLRKFGCYVIFATQELSDAMNSPIVHTILSACQSKIYLPDAGALNPAQTQLYRSFGLSPEEIRLIAHAEPRESYYYTSPRAKRLFSLGLQDLSLALLTSRDTEFLRGLIGLGPKDVILAILERAGDFEEAVELVETVSSRPHFYLSTREGDPALCQERSEP